MLQHRVQFGEHWLTINSSTSLSSLFVSFVLLTLLAAGVTACSKAVPDPPELSGFPRHHEALLVNEGSDFVYGDLFLADGCIRITHFALGRTHRPLQGFLLIWPALLSWEIRDGVAHVVDGDGVVVASEGEKARISGHRVQSGPEQEATWDWGSDAPGSCAGPYWVIGDEITTSQSLTADPSSESVFFPTLVAGRDAVGGPDALLEGTLALQGRCLRVVFDRIPGRRLVIWLSGFRPVRDANGMAVVNGGGNVVARVGEHLVAGGYSPNEVDYKGNSECPGRYFYAYTVIASALYNQAA